MDHAKLFMIVDALNHVAEAMASDTEKIIDALVPVAFSEEEADELKDFYSHGY